MEKPSARARHAAMREFQKATEKGKNAPSASAPDRGDFVNHRGKGGATRQSSMKTAKPAESMEKIKAP